MYTSFTTCLGSASTYIPASPGNTYRYMYALIYAFCTCVGTATMLHKHLFRFGHNLRNLPLSVPNRWCCTAFACLKFFTASLIFASPGSTCPSLCFALYHLTLALSALHISCKLIPSIRVSNLSRLIGTKFMWQRNSLVHQVKFLKLIPR